MASSANGQDRHESGLGRLLRVMPKSAHVSRVSDGSRAHSMAAGSMHCPRHRQVGRTLAEAAVGVDQSDRFALMGNDRLGRRHEITSLYLRRLLRNSLNAV